MLTRGRYHRSRFPLWFAVGLACAGLTAGCKHKDVGGSGGGGGLVGRNTDPIFGGSRIPPQGLPIPGRDSYGAKIKKDPLLEDSIPAGRRTEPVDRTDRGTPDNLPKGEPAASLPATNREPYRPSRATTVAALAAAPLDPDDRDLSIGRRPTVVPAAITGRPALVGSREEVGSTSGLGYDQITTELKKYGATWNEPERESEQYVFRCRVPVESGMAGLVRQYEGVGATPAAAAKQALDQVRDHISRR